MRVCPACSASPCAHDWTCPACRHQPERREDIVYFAPAFSDGDGGDATYRHEELVAAEDSHFWFRARAKLLVWALERHFPTMRSLLDVGCGRGAVLAAMRRRFPQASLAGSELLDVPLRVARSRLPGVDLYQMDARRLPFDREFDVVTSCDVLEHLDDDRGVARQLFRAVVPGGGVIVTVPQHRWLWSAVDIYSHHRRRYERQELAGVIEQAGFVVERATSFVTALLPLVLLSRRRQHQLTAAFDPTAELRIGRVANKVCENVLDLERWMIRAGVSLPIGSSLLVVARRPGA